MLTLLVPGTGMGGGAVVYKTLSSSISAVSTMNASFEMAFEFSEAISSVSSLSGVLSGGLTLAGRNKVPDPGGAGVGTHRNSSSSAGSGTGRS